MELMNRYRKAVDELFEKVRANIKKVIIGKDTEIKLILSAILSGGHVLMEDVPGTGKTVLAKSLSKSIESDFSRIQFEKDMKSFSEGQKKKVVIAKSLCEKAHLHIWDEPMNYIDVISRMQIEKLLMDFEPAILFVEHDSTFCEKIATKTIEL